MTPEKTDRNRRIWERWQTGRYKSYSSLSRIFGVTPKIVERVVKRNLNHKE